MAFGGSGVARIDDKVVFVPGTAPGETVTARIVSEKKNYSTARLVKVIEPSPHRTDTVCPFALRPESEITGAAPVCPGCSYQHIAYEEEVRIKDQQFREILKRQADLDPGICLPPQPSPEYMNYRNKITLHASVEEGQTALGYFMANNHSILDIPACPLACPAINSLLENAKSNPGFKHSLHDGMSVTFRHAENDETTYWRNKPPRNAKWLKEKTIIGQISSPLGSFFQVNPGCCDILISLAQKIITEAAPKNIIDIYCGTGLFSVAAAQKCQGKVIGLDSDPNAIKAAEYNAKQRSLDNCEFIASDADKTAQKVLKKVSPDESLLIVDPPRSGLGKKAIRNIEMSRIKTIVYISCAPDTLARDLKLLANTEYKVASSQLVDMFPRTSHFESITRLERK